MIFLSLITPILFSNEYPKKQLQSIASDSRIEWQPFTPEKIRNLIDTRKTVFIDITADWCITCKVNKVLVLDREPINSAIRDSSVIAMQADWTSPNSEILDFLSQFGRYGIPFNSVYGPNAPEGIVLPELLSSARVLEALQQAQPSSKKRENK